jgi:hypothetical protein
VPVTLVKLPLTFEMAKCRTVNWAVEWSGSMVQVEVCAAAETARKRASQKARERNRFIFTIPYIFVIRDIDLYSLRAR